MKILIGVVLSLLMVSTAEAGGFGRQAIVIRQPQQFRTQRIVVQQPQRIVVQQFRQPQAIQFVQPLQVVQPQRIIIQQSQQFQSFSTGILFVY